MNLLTSLKMTKKTITKMVVETKVGRRSRDGEEHKGHWIANEQWLNYCGMNGYVYLAMTDNIGGILYKITQFFRLVLA